jgi:tetratricopeptide (TPR) repeat protein
MIQGGIGEYEKALASYQQALGHQSGNELLLRNLGAIYGKLGRSREAIGVFKQAVALNEGKHLNHYLLALAYLQQGSFAAAEVEFEQTLRLQPGNGLANFYQGLTCLLRHALAKSKKYFLAAKHSDVKPDAGRYFLGLLELLGQQRQSALGEYRELKRYNKEAAIELLNLIEMAGLGEIKGDALIQAALRAYAALGY